MRTNPDFAKQNSYVMWKPSDLGEEDGTKIIAFFQQTSADSQIEEPQRSEDASASKAEPRSYAPVSGFARDYGTGRERFLPPPREVMPPLERRTFDYRGPSYRRLDGSPVRSSSPIRGPSPVRVHYEVRGPPMPVPPPHALPTFSHYEAHREQREQREYNEYQKAQAEHSQQYQASQMSLGIRERIIATYRAEIESHELNDRNFATVKAQLEDLRRRKEAFEMSATALKQDFEAQLHS